MKIIKRDGHIVDYCPDKIELAIKKANNEVLEEDKASDVQIKNIIKYIESLKKKRILVEDIQDIIEMKLMSIGKYALAKEYITYRYTRELVRRSNTTDLSIKELIDGENEYYDPDRNKKNAKNVVMQRNYLASITSTDITRRFLLPEDIVKAHDEGIIHFHNMDYFAQNALHNSSLINLEDIFKNKTNINNVMIDIPNSFLDAINISIDVITSVLNSEYGSLTISLAHLAPYVKLSCDNYLEKYKKMNLDENLVNLYAKEDLTKEIEYGIKLFRYQINLLDSKENRSVSIFMYLNEEKEYKNELAILIEELLKQSIKGIKDEEGNYISQTHPKLLYVLEEDNINEDSKYYYLTKLAAICTLNNKNSYYISEKVMKKFCNGKCFAPLGTNDFLTEYIDNFGNDKYYGRFNQGIVTINLVDVALSSDKDINLFWQILDERLELCHRALQVRHKRLSKATSSASKVLWQHGAISRLKENESLHDLLHNGYSTISLGFVGLYECVLYMKNLSYAKESNSLYFAFEIINKIKEKCNTWKEKEDIDYVFCGTMSNSVVNKFSRCLLERFGKIKGITDKNSITKAYHLPFDCQVSLLDKLMVEKEFQMLSVNMGASYINCPNNFDEMNKLLKLIYENIMYVKMK